MLSEGNAPKKCRFNMWFLLDDHAPGHQSILVKDLLSEEQCDNTEASPVIF